MAKSQAMTVLFIVTIIIVSIGAIALVIIAAMTSNKRAKQTKEKERKLAKEKERGTSDAISDDLAGDQEQEELQNGDAVYEQQMKQYEEQQKRLEEEYARQHQYYGGHAPAGERPSPGQFAPQNTPGQVQYGEYWGGAAPEHRPQQGQYAGIPGPNNPYGTGDPQQKLMHEEAARRQQEEMYRRQQMQQQQQQQQQGPGPMEKLFKSQSGGDRLMNPNSPDSQNSGPRPSGPRRKVKFVGMGGKSRAGGSYIQMKKSNGPPKQHDPNSERGVMLL